MLQSPPTSQVSDLRSTPFSPDRSTWSTCLLSRPGIATSFSLGKRAWGETWRGFLGKRVDVNICMYTYICMYICIYIYMYIYIYTYTHVYIHFRIDNRMDSKINVTKNDGLIEGMSQEIRKPIFTHQPREWFNNGSYAFHVMKHVDHIHIINV